MHGMLRMQVSQLLKRSVFPARPIFQRRLKYVGLIVVLLVSITGLWIFYIDTDRSLAANINMYKVSPTAHNVIPKLASVETMLATKMIGSRSNRSDIMRQRHDILRSGCKRLYGKDHEFLQNTNFSLEHFIYNDKYKIIYCYIPKIACTNLKRTFMVLEGKVNETNPLDVDPNYAHLQQFSNMRYLSQLEDKTEVMYRLKNFKKFIVVREPLERLLSAWRSKFENGVQPYFSEKFGRYIIKRFRENATVESLRKGDDVSFDEFLQYVIELGDKKIPLSDPHWGRYTDICHPCEVDYDFIGHYDTLDEDMAFLLEEIGASNMLRFPTRNESYMYNTKAKTRDIQANYYKDIPIAHLSRIYNSFGNDSFLFNYSVPAV